MFNDRQLKSNCPIMSSSCRNFQLSLSFGRPLPTSITPRNRCGQSNYSYFPFYIVRNPNILVTTDWLNRIQSQKRKSARKGSFSVSFSKYPLGKGGDELDPTCKRVKGYRKYFKISKSWDVPFDPKSDISLGEEGSIQDEFQSRTL